MGGDRDPVTEVKLGKLGRTRGQHLLKVEKELSRFLWAQSGDSQKPDLVGQSGLTAGTTVTQCSVSNAAGLGLPQGGLTPELRWAAAVGPSVLPNQEVVAGPALGTTQFLRSK